MELSLLTGVKIFLTIFDDSCLALPGTENSTGEGGPPGARLIQYQSDPIEAFREINVKKIASEEKYSNTDVRNMGADFWDISTTRILGMRKTAKMRKT